MKYLQIFIFFFYFLCRHSDAQEAMVYNDSLELSANLFRLEFDSNFHNSDVGALISTNLLYRKEKFLKDSIIISIPAVMYPDKSWIHPDLKDSKQLLSHELTHFRITELYARKLRRLLVIEKGGQQESKYRDLKAEWKKEQFRYDLETGHGTNLDKQEGWELHVAFMLEELKEYSSHYIVLPLSSKADE